MAFTESNLITLTDIRGYRDISPNIASNKETKIISDVQRENLRVLFGEEMYFDFFDSATENDYSALKAGETYSYGGYSIEYFGIKPYLCYLFLETYILEGDFYIGDAGMFTMDDREGTSKMDFLQRKTLAKEFRAKAEKYKADIIKYLNEHLSDFPLYFGSEVKQSDNNQFVKFTAR